MNAMRSILDMTAVFATTTDIDPLVTINVRVLMVRKGITQTQIAERLNISHVSVSRRMSGVVSWNVNELGAMADLFDVDPRDLLNP